MNDLVTLQKLEQSKLAIMEIKTLDEIKKVIDQAEALIAYSKSAQLSAEIQTNVAELNVKYPKNCLKENSPKQRPPPKK